MLLTLANVAANLKGDLAYNLKDDLASPHMLEQLLCYSSAYDLAHSLLYLQNLPKNCMVDLIRDADASEQD